MTSALYTLRCAQCGISYEYLRHMTPGMVFDVFTEAANDSFKYPYKATQEDIDAL